MWLQYDLSTPYGSSTRYYWTRQTDVSEALFDCKSTIYTSGAVSNMHEIEKPPDVYVRAMIAVLRSRLESINEEISLLEDYLNDSE